MSEVHPLRRANIKTASTQTKSNAKHSKNSIVDNGAFEKLEQILKDMESTDHSDDISPILVFLSKGFSTQLIQAWSYYSHINDHSKFTSCTVSLTKLIKRLSSTSVSTTSETANNGELSSAELQLQAIQSGVDIIKDILINHTKVIYRALTTLRASMVNPTLRLLNEFVVLGNGSLIDDFFSLFDFQLAVLPKLLNPTKTELSNIEGTKSKEYLSVRYCFIRFLLNFLKYANVIVRRDFIANNVKLFSSWVKHLGVIDSDSLIKLTLSQWSQYILQADSGVSKSLKIKVFNEWNVVKLLPVFQSKDPEVRSEFNQFLLRLFNDAKTGISFPSEDTWFSRTASATASSNTITVNGKHFKCNNRIIYAVLTHLKPWDDDLQSQLTLNVLQSHGELIAPYVNYLASRGLHEPKLTSYWLGQTLLISKIIRLPLSGDITREGAKPASFSLLRELIVPSLLNRAVLMKCIHTCDVALVRQLSNQLILDSLNKLNHVITNYLDEQKYVDLKNDLIQACYLQLPDLSTVCLSLSDNYNKTPQNKILLLTSLMIIQNYVTLFNDTYNYSTVITKPYMDLISNNNNSTDAAAASVSGFSNIDLVLLDQFFKLQKDQTSQFKWWIKSNGADHSLFTSLLQISTDSATSSNSGISVKIEELLQSLSSQTVIFNTSDSEKDINILKSSPIFPLLHSLQVIFSSSVKAKSTLSSIYKVIDETITRAVKTPYKYLDQSNIVDRVSVFICALLEQWKYLSCEDDQSRALAEKWLGLYLRYAVLSGESQVGVSSLLNAIDSSVVKKWLSAEESNLNDPIFQDNIDRLEYCDLITITPLNQLPSKLTATMRPTSDFDVLALLSRVNQIVSSEDSVSLKSVQEALNDMFTQFGDFMYSYPSSITGKFSQLRFWSDLYLSHENEVGNYVSQILSDVFEQLDSSCFNSDDFSSVVVSKLSNPITAADEAVALVLAGSVWCLSGEQLHSVALNHQSEMVKIGALKTMLDRGLTLSSEEVVGFVEDVSSTKTLLLVLKEFVKRDLIVFADFDALFEALIGSENSVCKEIIKQLISVPTDGADILAKLVEFVSKKNDLSLTMFIFSNISTEQYHQLPQSESLNELTNNITTHALSLLRSSNFTDFSAMELSNIFTLNAASTVLSSEDRQFILEYYLSSSATATDKYTGHVTALITAIGVTSESTSMIRTWINKSILYLTKIFAEFETIPDSTLSFLVSLESLLQVSSNVTGLMNKTNLNALLEVLYTKWCHLEPALKFSAVLVSVLESTKRVKIDGKKLLQILINNEEILLLKANEGADPKLNFLAMVNLLKLFKLDIAANSTMAIRDRLMLFYNGTTSASDLILFDVLEIIESKIGSSWIDSVYSWDLIDGLSQDDEDLVGSVRLVEKKKEGFVVSLNKRFITNGLSNYQMTKPAVPSTTDGAVWSALETFFEQCQSLRGPDQAIYYDPLFLTLLVINNDELVKVTTVEDSSDLITKINVKKLLDFDLLQTLILNLSSTDQNLVQITIKILSAIQASLDKSTASSSTTGDSSTAPTAATSTVPATSSSDVHFKDSLFIKLYLTKILYTFHSNPTTPRIPLTIHLISQILPILSNPSHDLYEKAYRWVIKSPSLHANDIPLYVDITSFNSKDTIETNDVYYKNVSWLLDNVRVGLRGAEDLRLLQSRGFIEWALNLLNNPYCFISVKFLVLELLDRVVELADGAGVMGLITRYAGLLNLEQEIGKARDTIITGSNREAKKLQQEQYLINLKQLAVKFGIVASSETTAGKRIREWTDGEVEGVVKRVVRA